MREKAFQDYYPEQVSYCYGCGRLNEKGLQIKSFWDGETAVCRYQPRDEHMALPGFVYGGLIASLIDCHGTGTAAAAMHRHKEVPMGEEESFRFVTASLHVDYLKPTPIDSVLEIRATVKEIKGRKVVVSEQLFADGVECARGEVVAVQVPEDFMLASRNREK